MRLSIVILFMALSSYGQAMQNCRDELRHYNPNRLLIASILNEIDVSFTEKSIPIPIRVELTVRCKAPLLLLPDSDIYKVYHLGSLYYLYVPERVDPKFLEFLKMAKVKREAEIPYIKLYTLDNENFHLLFLLYIDRLKNYFMFGVRKNQNFDMEEPESSQSAGAPSS